MNMDLENISLCQVMFNKNVVFSATIKKLCYTNIHGTQLCEEFLCYVSSNDLLHTMILYFNLITLLSSYTSIDPAKGKKCNVREERLFRNFQNIKTILIMHTRIVF